MKRLVFILLTTAFLFGCGSSTQTDGLIANTSTSMKIEGMTCEEMCAGRIEDKIARMEGVKFCEVDFKKKTATLSYDKEKVDIENLVLKVEDMNDGQYTISDVNTHEIVKTDSDLNSNGGNEAGQILSTPSFELPNIAEYFRNII